MTAKEQLRQLVDQLPEEDLVESISREANAAGLDAGVLQLFARLVADHPEADEVRRLAEEAKSQAGRDEDQFFAIFLKKMSANPRVLEGLAGIILRGLVLAANSAGGSREYRRLHALVDHVPEPDVPTAIRILEALCAIQPGAQRTSNVPPEDRAWMETDLSRLGEFGPYEWGAEGPPEGLPVHHVPGVGIVIG